MSFDFEIAMAVLEELGNDEREALFTAAKFLLSTTTPKGAYAFTATNVQSINVKHIENFAPVQSDMGDYRTNAEVMRGGGTVEVTFKCPASQFRGLFIKPGPEVSAEKPAEKPVRQMEPLPKIDEEKEMDRMLSRIIYTRKSREKLVK